MVSGRHGTAGSPPRGARGGRKRVGTLPSFHDVKTVHWRWPGSARGTGGTGAETSVLAL